MIQSVCETATTFKHHFLSNFLTARFSSFVARTNSTLNNEAGLDRVSSVANDPFQNMTRNPRQSIVGFL